ncbi:uncharacterized protein LOC116302193 isoform X2 [Actinia tenebrosa]|uniref:Uncharacterized protein LOC116302193 isoform X2 n=1 Tax=Actinia tenebrosa TaxID=6105 RepID=A0A6P8IK31_ACTTE|nr:uncharacterized protein LOC116302193 isoform X2 [Actinia tenebrosa]
MQLWSSQSRNLSRKMTQGHKSKQTLQVLTKKSCGRWKTKTIVLKNIVESQKRELYIYHPLQAKAFRKFYPGNGTVIHISPHSHAVIRGLSQDGMENVMCLLKLQENEKDDLHCQFFFASTEQKVSDFCKLGDTIQELCEVSTFAVDVLSTNGRITPGPAYLHFSKNRVFLSSKIPTITILKEWQFRSLQNFHFEVLGIHIYDTVDHSQEEVFVSCRSNKDNRSIQQIISSQCPGMPTMPQSVFQREQNELPIMLPPSPTSSTNNSDSLSSCLSDTELQTILEGPDNNDCQLKKLSKSTSSNELQKSPLKQTQRSQPVIKKAIQSPGHSVKEHVVIRFPTQKRSKSISDLRLRPLNEKEQVTLQPRAFSLDSDQAFTLKQKSKANGEWIKKDQGLEESVTESNCDGNSNGENTGLETALDMRQKESDTHSAQPQALTLREPNTNKPDCSPHYENFESRPNCYMYWNTSFPDDAPEVPKTYVNVFCGSSIKCCYENWHSGVFDHEFNYSSIDELFAEPPPLPQPRRPPPRLPPRVNKDSHRELYPGRRFRNKVFAPEVPQRPPKRPPKSSNLSVEIKPNTIQSDISSTAEVQGAPKIQVALFASPPVSGLVWFLRVAFMHQDESDTTFKRVKGVEEASKHKLIKSELLEVFADINVAMNVQTTGFDLLNDSQQEVESSDIDNLRKGDWFVIEFRIKQSDHTQVQFDGSFLVEPKAIKSCRRTCKISFGISENFQTKPTLSSTETPPTSKPLKINFIQYEKLCKALDPITSSSQDWRHMANALGFTREEIDLLVSKYHRNVHFSPTDEILQSWEQRDPNCSLQRLVNILRELERLDIVQDLGYCIEPEEKFNDGFKKI